MAVYARAIQTITKLAIVGWTIATPSGFQPCHRCHNYIGHNYIGHNWLDHSDPEWIPAGATGAVPTAPCYGPCPVLMKYLPNIMRCIEYYALYTRCCAITSMP